MRRLSASPIVMVIAGLVAFGVPVRARAQELAKSSEENIAQVPQTQGPMTLERVHSGWAITPDYRITDFDHTTGQLLGAYGGWVYDSTILIGAGGYWMTNGSNNHDLQYGGAVVEWLQHADRAFGFSVRGLVGWGTSRLPGTVSRIVEPTPRFDRDGRRLPSVNPPTTTIVPVVFHDDFFVFEPQASALIRVTRLMRINAGVGYRITDGAHGLDDRIHGVSGSIGLQIGGVYSSR
jgi:hypothetical protein